jgi:hypothetical protein
MSTVPDLRLFSRDWGSMIGLNVIWSRYGSPGAPVVGILGGRVVVAGHPLLEHEGAGADGVRLGVAGE